jgi:hypothetical protein
VPRELPPPLLTVSLRSTGLHCPPALAAAPVAWSPLTLRSGEGFERAGTRVCTHRHTSVPHPTERSSHAPIQQRL